MVLLTQPPEQLDLEACGTLPSFCCLLCKSLWLSWTVTLSGEYENGIGESKSPSVIIDCAGWWECAGLGRWSRLLGLDIIGGLIEEADLEVGMRNWCFSGMGGGSRGNRQCNTVTLVVHCIADLNDSDRLTVIREAMRNLYQCSCWIHTEG